MGNAILSTFGAFLIIVGANLGASAIAWRIYPKHRKMVKIYLIVTGILTLIFTFMTISMFYQISQMGF